MRKFVMSLVVAALAASVVAEWSTFHGNNRRTGFTPTLGPSVARVLWSADVLGSVITSPVIGPTGTIYIGPVLTNEKRPRLVFSAINPDGSVKWRFVADFEDDQAIGTPAVDAQGRVYFGSAAGFFYCLSSNGELLWKYDANTPIMTHVLVGGDGNIYATLGRNLTSFTPAGQLRWQFDLGQAYPGGPTETFAGDLDTVSSNGIVCLTRDGTLRWRSVAGGTLAPPVVTPSGEILTTTTNFVWLNPNTGVPVRYGFAYLYGTFGSPLVDLSGNVYHVVDYDLWKYSPNGVELVHNYLDDPSSNFLGHSWGSMAMDGAGRIFLGLGNGKRSAIAYEKNLQVMNSNLIMTRLVSMPHIAGTSSAAIGANGNVYLGCLDGRLYAFGN